MFQPSDNIWNQKAQKTFFALLKKEAEVNRGALILAKAEQLVNHKNGTDHDLLKGAESLINMYTLKYRCAENEDKANTLLASIYSKLGETEKANRFLK